MLQSVLAIAFNDHLGWSHTVNSYHGADLYRDHARPGGYRWEGGENALEVAEQTILVKGAGEEKLTVRKTVREPIVLEEGTRAVALRVAGLDASGNDRRVVGHGASPEPH